MKTITIDHNVLSQVGGRIYFSSDLHYNHENMIRIANRNFKDVTEMNSYIRKELKSKLHHYDCLFDLGDMTWKVKDDEFNKLMDCIPCVNFYKILGNHDNEILYRNSKKPIVVEPYIDLVIQNTYGIKGNTIQISLFHFPIEDYNHMYHGGLHLFGHVHGELDDKYKIGGDPKLMADVGFDSALAEKAGSFLISLDDILGWFLDKTGDKTFREWAKENYK